MRAGRWNAWLAGGWLLIGMALTLASAVPVLAQTNPNLRPEPRPDLLRFLDKLHERAAAKSSTSLCELLAYPIIVSTAVFPGDLEVYGTAHDRTYFTVKQCRRNFTAIFGQRVLARLRTLSIDDLQYGKDDMLSVDRDFLWIDRAYIGRKNAQGDPIKEDFDNEDLWQYRILNINDFTYLHHSSSGL